MPKRIRNAAAMYFQRSGDAQVIATPRIMKKIPITTKLPCIPLQEQGVQFFMLQQVYPVDPDSGGCESETGIAAFFPANAARINPHPRPIRSIDAIWPIRRPIPSPIRIPAGIR